jgi:glyoxylate utilization-related uncharacterized protein
MDAGGAPDRISFLRRRLPPVYELRVVSLDPGAERPFDEAEWRDALVVVEQGELEVECLGDSRHRFARGDILWLSGLPLRALHSRGRGPAVLVAVSRRRRGTWEEKPQ